MRTAITEKMSNEELNVVFEEIIRKANIPVIIADTMWEPVMWKNVFIGPFFNRKEVVPHDTTSYAFTKIKNKIKEFRKIYEPKVLYLNEPKIKIGYLVFGNSELVQNLSRMPYIEAVLIAAFIFFAFLGFHNIRITERSNLWVGLAKETAHQLGTPISSLMGWVEYIRGITDTSEPIEPEDFVKQVHVVAENMENDLGRLRKVANRFSQIGSVPELSLCDINEILDDVVKYFRSRLPFLGKRIQIKLLKGDIPKILVNRQLIEWVFENLLKNSVDAIIKQEGIIEIKTEYIKEEKKIKITHNDNGKGITWEEQKKIFAPGYTTKKRGWGLGLTLAKRIVEDYHKGKIYLFWSQKDKGSTFCVELPCDINESKKKDKNKQLKI
jgi:signal transduction histidine kinase